MSRFTVSRLEGLRKFKDNASVAAGADTVLSSLPDNWLSDRNLTRSDVAEKLGKVWACASKVDASDGGVDSEGRPVLDVLRANWCKCHSVCSICSARLQSKRRTAYTPTIRECVSRFPFAYMVTFTVASGWNLGERLDHLRQSFRRWYRMGQRRGSGRSGGESSAVGGALLGVEATKGDAGWHVHIHALVFCDRKLDYRVYDPIRLRAARVAAHGRALSADTLLSCVSSFVELGGERVPVSKLSGEWFSCTGGDSVNIDVRPIRGGLAEVEHSALEVLKYSTKLNSSAGASAAEYIEVLAGTYGRRMFSALRAFRGVLSPKAEYDDPGESDYSLVWDAVGGGYRPVRTIARNELRGDALSVSGVLVGQWRRDRRDLIAAGGDRLALVQSLDRMKAVYRAAVKSIWRAASRESFVESCRAVLRPSPAVPEWVQLSLFAT